ncbi:MAG: 4-hydroxy-3-methylbut-2-enyl diphosphate reductase [bacterium]|nr:4-hydroxy-3-methylbut-2-enyl diphosphate reductase [bacterium]
MLEKILIAQPRGFCAGVDRAITIVEAALVRHGAPVYVRHEIVHNRHVNDVLVAKGAIIVEETDEIPVGAVAILSAHGVPKKVYEEAQQRSLQIYDATCPLVTKVHGEAKRFHDQLYSIVMIGHRGHQEVIGTMGQVPDVMLVESVEDVEKLEVSDPSKVAVITQTTLSVDDTRSIMEALKTRFPEMHLPPRQDICYATQNRQDAVKELVKHCELVLVVGAEHSSNSCRLRDVSLDAGVESYLIPDKMGLKREWFEGIQTVGLTSGASVPEDLVRGVVDQIQEWFSEAREEVLLVVVEKAQFALPKELVGF